MNKKDFPHGIICVNCAKEKGLEMPLGLITTFWEGVCPYCKKYIGICTLEKYKEKKGNNEQS